jgi:hypothetical protein
MFGWFKKKEPEIDPARLVDTMGAIVADYGEFLEKSPHGAAIQGEKYLPHPKENILTALCIAIATQDFSTEMRAALVDCAMSLALFQTEIGNHAVHQRGVDITKFDTSSMSSDNLAALLLSNPAGKEKYDLLFPIVQADITRITRRVTEANRIWAEARNMG